MQTVTALLLHRLVTTMRFILVIAIVTIPYRREPYNSPFNSIRALEKDPSVLF